MKKELLEEIRRIKFISNYNSEFTSEENKQTLIEQGFRSIIRDTSQLRGLMSDIEKVLSSEIKGGAFVTKDLKQLKTADEIIEALRLGKLAPAEQGRLSWNIFRKTDNPVIMKAIAEDTVQSKTFIQKYGSLDKQTFVNRLKDKYKLNSKQTEELWRANSRRISSSTKEGESAFKTAKQAEEAARRAEEAARRAEAALKEAEDAARKAKVSSEEVETTLSSLNRSERRWLKNWIKINKINNFEVWIKDRGNFERFLLDLRSRGGIWNRVFKWGKRTVLFSGLIALTKFLIGMGLLGFGVWWLYGLFTKSGWDVECEPGYYHKKGVGCVKRGGGDEDEEDKDEEDKDEEDKKDGYVECDTLYKKGCKNKKGNTDIIKAQECLKVNVTGLFDQATEDALFKKINKRTFTKDDLNTICSKGFDAPEYLI